MSATYHRVYPGLWDEPWDDDTRHMALYLLTCRHRTTEGLFRLPWAYVIADIGWPESRARTAWGKLLEHGFIEHDEQASVVWICKAIVRQPPQNVNQAKAVVKSVGNLPYTPLISRFRTLAETVSEQFVKALDELSASTLGDPPSSKLQAPASPPSPPSPPRGPAPEGADAALRREFDEWLLDHQAVTSNTPPKAGTKARDALFAAFKARRTEDYSLAALKLASRGAMADTYRREKGYTTADSVLRPQKVHNLIERGRGTNQPTTAGMLEALDAHNRGSAA